MAGGDHGGHARARRAGGRGERGSRRQFPRADAVDRAGIHGGDRPRDTGLGRIDRQALCADRGWRALDVLLAADAKTPQRLVDEGHAVAGSNFTYAIGQLVLWSADADLVDEDGAVLGSDRYTRIAAANPRLAPYGVAAYQVLEARKLLDAVSPRIVTGENIAQAYQFVLTRNADIGFVALSQLMSPGKPTVGSIWRVPQELYSVIRQDAVLLEHGESNEAARALLEYLQTPLARDSI